MLNGGNLDYDFNLDVPAGDYRIEFFNNPSGADVSGYGEGETYIGFININHSGSGVETFNGSITPLSIPSDSTYISLTTTECKDGSCTTFNNTSEFSGIYLFRTNEICDNGIDDDGDGYSDCFDSNCPCYTKLDLAMCAEPDIASGFITVDYNSTTDQFTANGFALNIDSVGSVADVNVNSGSFDITAIIDDTGAATSGTLTISGQFSSYNGVLITGTITDFGYPLDGAGVLEFMFQATGGQLVDQYGGIGNSIGVILGGISGFTGNWSVSWNGGVAGSSDTAPANCPVGGQVRNDVDEDGNLADNDAGIPGVTVSLYDDGGCDGTPDALRTSMTTDTDGNYYFPNIPEGCYVIAETDLPGYLSTNDADLTNDNTILTTQPYLSAYPSLDNDYLDAMDVLLTCVGTMTTPCYDNSTGTVTDDRYWPNIDLSADTDNWGYNASDNQGNSWTFGSNGGSFPHSYYRTDTFPIVINITGQVNGCTQSFTITDPPSCSVACDTLTFSEVSTVCVNDSMVTTINVSNTDNTCWEAIRKIDELNVTYLMSGQGDGNFTLPPVSISDVQATPTPTNYTLWVHSVDCIDTTIVFHDCVFDIVVNIPNCSEICNNCIDDDGDGLTDCDDSDCACVLPELEFCTYNLKLNYNETFNIRDFVHVLDESMAVDWSQVYFTYTAVGANDPVIPSDWHLSDFNNGLDVTITSADDDSGTGNSGDGRYRIYLVRNGQSSSDDHMTIGVEDGSSNSSDSKCLIEICGNLCDDDGDGLIDGADPDCTCNNFVDAGTITGDESNCDSYDPSLITEVTGPSGGLGVVQYQWQYENGSGWTNLIGTDSATYDPMTITVTTQYRRGVRRSPCTTWVYSNVVTKTVNTCSEICNNSIDDDGDGLIDCDDPDCQDITAMLSEDCTNGGIDLTVNGGVTPIDRKGTMRIF